MPAHIAKSYTSISRVGGRSRFCHQFDGINRYSLLSHNRPDGTIGTIAVKSTNTRLRVQSAFPVAASEIKYE